MSVKLNECIVCKNIKSTLLFTSTTMMHHSNKKFNFFICRVCNLVFLNPRVPLNELKEYYTNYYLPYRGSFAWGKYEKLVSFTQHQIDLKRVKMINKYSCPNKDSIILDVGCGNPTFLETCSDFFNSSLFGIDFSDSGWKREKVRFNKLNLKVADVNSLNKNFNPDIISLWHYLEHDYYPNKTLKKLASISNINTRLYIEVPNYDSLSRKKYKQNWSGFHTPRHTFIFSPNNIEILLNNNGWQVDFIDLKGTLDPYILYWMSEMEIKGLDWSKSMENEFWSYFYGLIKYKLKHLFTNKSKGIMTIIAKKKR